MTDSTNTYWIRKKDSIGPGQRHGRLLGEDHKGKRIWTIKVGAAVGIVGGEKLDRYLVNNPDCELIEVVESGTRNYHGKCKIKWVPK